VRALNLRALTLRAHHHSFAARLMKPGCLRDVNSALLMREVLGERNPHHVMSRLEMKRFSTSANLIGHSDVVYCLAVNTSNTVVLTGSDDYRVKAWSICPNAGVGLISTMRGHQGYITQVMFNPQDEEIAISCDSSFCAVRFWRIANGQQLRLIVSHEYNGREDVFFDLKNCMGQFLVTITRNEIKFWSFAAEQQRLTLDDRGDPELHRPEFGITLPHITMPSMATGKHIEIIAMHPSLPFALVATVAGSLYLITMLPNAGPNQYAALQQQVTTGAESTKEDWFTQEITEMAWNSSGTRFFVAGKNWDSNILIVPFKLYAASCFIEAATNQAQGSGSAVAYCSRAAVPQHESGGPKFIVLDSLVCTKDIRKIDLKALDESLCDSTILARARPACKGCKEITCTAWSREGGRVIVGCCTISLVGAQRAAVTSKAVLAVVRVFCASTGALLVSFDQIHDRPISSIISHPTQCDIFMTASYDGDVTICDISSMSLEVLHGTAYGYEDATYRVPLLPFNVDGCKIKQPFNDKPQISESCWQRSDTIVVARKSGHISLINAAGFEDPIFRDAPPGEAGYAPVPAKKWRCRVWGSGSADQVLPEDHFFLFEKRKLKWDQWGTAVDEVTEARTHLMPRGPLCNRHYESYEAFGCDAGIWEQGPLGMLQGVAGQQFFNSDDREDDDSHSSFAYDPTDSDWQPSQQHSNSIGVGGGRRGSARSSALRPKTASAGASSASAAAAVEPKQRRFGVDAWSIPAPRLIGAAEASREWLSKSHLDKMDKVCVPQIGDVVHYFCSGHAEARGRRDADPVRQLFDGIEGNDIAALPNRIKGTVQRATPRLWVGRKLDEGATTELKHCDREFHVVMEVVIIADDDRQEFTVVYHSEDQWLVPVWEVVVQGEGGLPDPPLPLPVPAVVALVALIDTLCKHKIASELFDRPVNLRECPAYTHTGGIALPVDLSLIRARLLNGYYRSLDAVLCDVDLIARNAHLFHDEEHSHIPALAEAVFCVFNQHIAQLQRQHSGEEEQPMQLELEDSWESSIWSQELRPTLCQFKKCLSKLNQCDKYNVFGSPVDDNEAPGYSKIIAHRIDLGTMNDKISAREYVAVRVFCSGSVW